ncbi:uncharacterized protein GIQ15_06760 [Arthroderma uncinatum]|uniref:uncharacterized protein n=1 Tax=Arthroderma uncinatum TaxID=74035 RepID=UPI00144A6652|nr:uncharacterized protein GIQ15_06760 [Arthroderma uncinatum]KAF3479784.1 hypothetical protein GIQ15_06760 [Arthroderma uncinatum]
MQARCRCSGGRQRMFDGPQANVKHSAAPYSTPLIRLSSLSIAAVVNNTLAEDQARASSQRSDRPPSNAQLSCEYVQARAALIRLKDLHTILKWEPNGKTNIGGHDRAALETFESIYGQVYWGRGRSENSARTENFLRSATERNPDIDIWCSEDFFTKEYPKDIEVIDKEDWWDSRPAERGGQVLVENRWVGCNDDYAYSRNVELDDGKTITVLVLCPPSFEEWSNSQFSGPLADIRAMDMKKDTPLDKITENNIAGTLLHEFSHAETLLSGLETVDVNNSEGNSYGWEAITLLAKETRDGALDNGDSYMFILMALYLDKNNWYSGIAQEVPPLAHGVLEEEEDGNPKHEPTNDS